MPTPRRKTAKVTSPDDFIEAGGSSPKSSASSEKPSGSAKPQRARTKRFSITMPEDLVELVDQARQDTMMNMERSQWLCQAALEKLKRDESKQ